MLLLLLLKLFAVTTSYASATRAASLAVFFSAQWWEV